MKLTVLDGATLTPGDLSWEDFAAFGELTVYDTTPPEKVIERARDCEIVLLNKTPIGEKELSQLPKLRYIGVLATGYNVIDTAAAAKRAIPVTNIPGYGTDAVAQHTFALLLAMTNPVPCLDEKVRDGIWWEKSDLPDIYARLTELSGLTLGVIGCGRIGQKVADIARTFGMKVVSCRRHPDKTSVSLETLLQESDIVSLHCPQTAETERLLNKHTLALMKRGALLVNTSRGGLIDEADVAEALKTGQLGGYASDVLTVEPPEKTNPLFSAPNCLLTPHVAWAPKATRQRLMDMAVQNLRAFLSGEDRNRVN